jgi:sugar lactone lactonase YvrE
MKVGLAGENPTALVTGVTNPGGIAAHGSDVYYAEAGKIMKVPVAGGLAVVVAVAQTTGAIAVDAGGVYWANAHDGTVMTVALEGGAPRVLASGQKIPSRLALDACNVYWLDGAAGTLMRVSR